jgi:hypothetical protein
MSSETPSQQEVESPDGLPVVQPTRSRVEEALEYTDRSPEAVVAEVPPLYGQATVEKIATNAVLAGCEPEYLPVVIAAVEGMTHEKFNLYGILSTTHPVWPVVMVNGPLAEELEINYGVNAMGQGFKANATIGRAVSMICMNIGGAIPGQSDDATLGGPHKFGLCWAENEDQNPWDPLHVERGFDPSTSTVTVFGAEPPHNINDHVSRDAASVLTTVVDTMATVGNNEIYFNEDSHPHVNLGPEHAEVIAEDGWTKQDVKRFIYDQARVPKYLFDGHGMDFNYGEDVSEKPWPTHFNVGTPHQMIGMCPSPDNVIITVAGGPGRQSAVLPTFGDTAAQTVPVTLEDGTPVSSVEEFTHE